MSDVWLHSLLDATDKTKALCRLCGVKISRGKSGTTSAMKKHLKIHSAQIAINQNRNTTSNQEDDPNRVEETVLLLMQSEAGPSRPIQSDTEPTKRQLDSLQPTLVECMDRKSKFSINDTRSKKITTLIAQMICLDNQPLCIVEDKGFNNLITYLEPRYKMVSRKHIANKVIPDMYESAQKKVAELLQQADFVSLTVDMWTSSANDDFMGITAHFVNSDYVACHLCLEVRPFREVSHNAENLINFIEEVCKIWNITDKIFVVVRDNARNITAALNSSRFKHLPCLAHTLQLVVKDGIFDSQTLYNLFSLCRRVVGHYKHSTPTSKVLKKAQNTVGAKNHRLIQDEPTRWNSSLLMVKRLLEQKQALTLAATELPRATENITPLEWEKLQNVSQLLQIFYDATLAVSSSCVTISEVIPIVKSILRHLEDLTLPGFAGVRNDLEASLKQRFNTMEADKEYSVAVLLDPRFKGKAFTSKTNLEAAKQMLLNEINKDSSEVCLCQNETKSKIGVVSATVENKRHGMWKFYSKLLEAETQAAISQDTMSAEEELVRYLSEEPLQPDESVLGYWKSQHSKYPRLSKAARKYHSCPPASVFCERLFSSAGIILIKNGADLIPKD